MNTTKSNKTSDPNLSKTNITASAGPMYSDLQWIFLEGKAIGKVLKRKMSREEIERWLYE